DDEANGWGIADDEPDEQRERRDENADDEGPAGAVLHAVRAPPHSARTGSGRGTAIAPWARRLVRGAGRQDRRVRVALAHDLDADRQIPGGPAGGDTRRGLPGDV